MKAYLTLTVKDRNGKIIKEIHEESKSFVKQFMQMLLSAFNGNASVGVKAIDDINYTLLNSSANTDYWLRGDGGAGNYDWGIEVGTGVTAVTANDNKLVTPITHGVGAGQLNYSAMTFDADVNVIGNDVMFTASRTLTNGSGGAITINEVGLILRHKDITATIRRFLAIRDLKTITVPNGATVTATYTIKITA